MTKKELLAGVTSFGVIAGSLILHMASTGDSKPPYTPEPIFNPTSTPEPVESVLLPGFFYINPDTSEAEEVFAESQEALYATFTDSPYCGKDGLELKMAEFNEDEWDYLAEQYPELYMAYYNCEIWLLEMKDGTQVEIER